MGINPFLVSAILFALAFTIFFWIPETLGYKAGDQIEEVMREKNQNEEDM